MSEPVRKTRRGAGIELSPEALEARRAYMREYQRKRYAKNPRPYLEAAAKYWERKAREAQEGGATGC